MVVVEHDAQELECQIEVIAIDDRAMSTAVMASASASVPSSSVSVSVGMPVRGRRESIERGGRIAETGSLVRNRHDSLREAAGLGVVTANAAASSALSSGDEDATLNGNTSTGSSDGTSTDGH